MENAKPKCAKCGNDGSESALYIAVDLRRDPARQGWVLTERDDSGGRMWDCLACDHNTEVHGDESGVPYDLIVADRLPLGHIALTKAESFIAGFEDDETQEGIADLLSLIRTTIKCTAPDIVSPAPAQPMLWRFAAARDGDMMMGTVRHASEDVARSIALGEAREHFSLQDTPCDELESAMDGFRLEAAE